LIEKIENQIYYLNDTERATNITLIMFFRMLTSCSLEKKELTEKEKRKISSRMVMVWGSVQEDAY
jgi:hypothetical protein